LRLLFFPFQGQAHVAGWFQEPVQKRGRPVLDTFFGRSMFPEESPCSLMEVA